MFATALLVGCSKLVDLGGVETGYTPPGPKAGSPFTDPAFRAGLVAWRRPRASGACAGCHTVDAIDLAAIGFSDATIERYARAQGANDADVAAIVALVHGQRVRWNLTAPPEPTTFRPLQPGGALLPGDSLAARDGALRDELRAHGLAIAGDARIDSEAAAAKAIDQILNLDLRTVRVGVALPTWSEDPFRGEAHRSSVEWLPAVARSPRPGRDADWYALANEYLEAPSPATLWAMLAAVEELTDDGGVFGANPAVLDGKLRLYQHARAQFRSVQLLGHMLRLGTAQLPSADDVSAADLARIPPGFHDGASADPAAEVVHERVNTLWEAGESTFGYTGTWSAAPAALKAQIPLSPDGHPDAVWASENQAMGLAAMWLGFTYDPARQLVGHADSGTYFYGLIASVAAPAHEDWAHVLEWVHDHFGLDTRFGFGDPGRWRVNGDLARIYPSSPSGCLVVAPDARDASASRTRFVSQVLRMQLYAASAWLAASKRYEDRARWNACFAEWTDVIPQVEDGPGQAELEAVVARVRAAFASSIDAPGGYTAAEARAKPFLNPMRHDPLPLPR